MKADKDTFKTGFFVDCDGNTRKVDPPRYGTKNLLSQREGHSVVYVVGAAGFVDEEYVWWDSEESIKNSLEEFIKNQQQRSTK